MISSRTLKILSSNRAVASRSFSFLHQNQDCISSKFGQVIRRFANQANGDGRSDNLSENEILGKVTVNPPRHQSQSIQRYSQGRRTIIEPPIRSRPFRPYRGAARLPTVRKSPAPTPRRLLVPSSEPMQKYGSYPVQAVHVAQSVDLAQVISKVFATRGLRRMMERLSVVIQLSPESQLGDGDKRSDRFVAVFRYGPVVFFNVSPRDIADFVWRIKECSKDPYLAGNERKENFCVHVQPDLLEDDEDSVTGEYCVVKEMNLKSVDVIANIMAQSVALDSYNDAVDELLAKFEDINSKVTSGRGNLSDLDRDEMFQSVARNNSIFIEMVSKVGLKDRSDTAWNLSQYENIHDGMKEEFDINQRFEHIEFKLNMIQENAKFFLEVLAHKKSNSLEWIIIILIMFECVLMCMEMSGYGPAFFELLTGAELADPGTGRPSGPSEK